MRKAKKKINKKIFKIADKLLLEHNIDARALATHPIDTLRGKKVVSGAKIRKYLDLPQVSHSMYSDDEIYIKMSSTRTQTKSEASGTDKTQTNPDHTTFVGGDQSGNSGNTETDIPFIDQDDVPRFKNGVPQFQNPSNRLRYALHRFSIIKFPLTLEELEGLDLGTKDELLWIMGAISLTNLSAIPELCHNNGPVHLPDNGIHDDIPRDKGDHTLVGHEDIIQSTPIAPTGLLKTPLDHLGVGVSQIRQNPHSTFTNVGEKVRILDKHKSDTSEFSAEWDPYDQLTLHQEQEYLTLTTNFKSKVAHGCLERSKYGAGDKQTPLDNVVSDSLTGATTKRLPSGVSLADVKALIRDTSKVNRTLNYYVQRADKFEMPSEHIQAAQVLLPAAVAKVSNLDETHHEVTELIHQIHDLTETLSTAQGIRDQHHRQRVATGGNQTITETPKSGKTKGGFPGRGGPPDSDSDRSSRRQDNHDHNRGQNNSDRHGGNDSNDRGGEDDDHNDQGGGGSSDPPDSDGGSDNSVPSSRPRGRGSRSNRRRRNNFENNVASILQEVTRAQRRSEANQLRIADRLGQIPNHGGHTDGMTYQNALKTLSWFSGRSADDFTGCPSAARNNIEPDCDRWVAAWRRMCASFRLDPVAERNSFYDRLAGDALEHLIDYRTTKHDMQYRIHFLRMRFAIIRSFEAVCAAMAKFERKGTESLNVCINRLEKLGTEYMSASPECSVEVKNLLVWNTFVTLVPHPRLAERFEQLKFTSANLQEAIRLAQQHYNRYELAPWSSKHLEKEKQESNTVARKSNSITTGTENKANKSFLCYNCNNPGHRAADCIMNSDGLKNIKSNQSGISGQGRGQKPDSKPSTGGADGPKLCFWCDSPDHSRMACTGANRILAFLKERAKRDKSKQPNQKRGQKPNSNSSRQTNQITSETLQEAEYELEQDSSHPDDSTGEAENC